MDSIPVCAEINENIADSEIFTAYLTAARAKAFHKASACKGKAEELLAEAALENIRRDDALFELFAKAAGREKISFGTLKKEYQAENIRRKEKEAEGKTVYGLTSFTITQYIRYVTDNMKASVLDSLKSSGASGTDDASLEKFYKTVSETDPLFRAEDGGVKPLGDVRAKVSFLYEEYILNERLGAVMKNQRVKTDKDAVRETTAKFLKY